MNGYTSYRLAKARLERLFSALDLRFASASFVFGVMSWVSAD